MDLRGSVSTLWRLSVARPQRRERVCLLVLDPTPDDRAPREPKPPVQIKMEAVYSAQRNTVGTVGAAAAPPVLPQHQTWEDASMAHAN